MVFIFTQQYDSKINGDPSDFFFFFCELARFSTEPQNVKLAFNTCFQIQDTSE